MKTASIFLMAIFTVGAAAAQAQTPTATAPKPFIMFTAGATVGHKTGAVFGGELGWPLGSSWEVVVEGGRMLNTKTAEMDAAASIISQFLARGGASASFTAKQPVTYGDAGLRYKFPTTGRFQPYAGLGVGAAKVSRNVSFIVNGNDVTAQLLDTFGVQLGTDLAGSETKGLVTFGIGTQYRITGSLLGDVSYRYGRVFLPGQGLNLNRVQFGIGVRF